MNLGISLTNPKNGDCVDNRLENLELWSTKNPKGQRVVDKVAYAHSILSEYGVSVNLFTTHDAISGLLLG
jgi:hypothetical protein